MKAEAILIAGANGLIGTELCEMLGQRGHHVARLVRRPDKSRFTTYLWDPDQDRIDPEAVEGKDTIINLAGANIGARRWTKSFRKEILESRTRSAAVLRRAVEAAGGGPHTYISAAGTSIYGTDGGRGADVAGYALGAERRPHVFAQLAQQRRGLDQSFPTS